MFYPTKDIGQYGYLSEYKKRKIIICLILALMIAFDIVLTYLMFGTTKHVIIVFAVILSLPFAKTVIALIMIRNHKPLLKEQYDCVKTLENIHNINIAYDVSVTLYEGNRFYQAVVVRNEQVIALVLNREKGTSNVSYKNFIENSICKDKYKYEVIIIKSIDEFVEKVNNTQVDDNNVQLVDKYMMDQLLLYGTR